MTGKTKELHGVLMSMELRYAMLHGKTKISTLHVDTDMLSSGLVVKALWVK